MNMFNATARVTLMALVVMSGTGCGKLSKEEADASLRKSGVVLAALPVCAVHLPAHTKSTPFGIELPTYSGEKECADYVMKVGLFQRSAKDSCVNRDGVCVEAARRDVKMTCTSPRGGGFGGMPFEMDCTAEFLCGTADLAVDAITTDGKAATIRYTITRSLDTVYEKPPSGCEIQTPFKQTEEKNATFIKTDDGVWIMGK